ncbi:hypothetical protein L484_006343 [Morus notabilis]|uniref:Uncharacterized protein n=1 Tax=Morus notabilis TaxID=981085 RepID=W9S036_9ROSA|nr:hypothetical protein L484_006343 [Morus notabilis]
MATFHKRAPTKSENRFKGFEENIENVEFSSRKLKELSFQYKYSLENMFVGAVQTCREKGLLPLAHERRWHGGDNDDDYDSDGGCRSEGQGRGQLVGLRVAAKLGSSGSCMFEGFLQQSLVF